MDISPQDVNQIEEKAMQEEKDAKKATDVVNNAISHMVPQRHFNEDKSVNRR